MLEEFLGRTSCQPHLAWAPQFVTWEGEGEGNKTRRRIVVGHWFCQVRGNYASAAAADGALRRPAAEADKSEPTQGAARVALRPRCLPCIA